MYVKWIPAIEIISQEAGEWNGWSLGFSRGNIHVFEYITEVVYALLRSDVTRRDPLSVVMDAGSRIVNFIRDGTAFA